MDTIDHSPESILQQLPGLDCGLCGARTCAAFAELVAEQPGRIERCIHVSQHSRSSAPAPAAGTDACVACAGCSVESKSASSAWTDSLGREYDFVLDSFPDEPGPRETILPHNPARTRDLDVKVGDVLIGRPMGMSCGCPITHCGIAMKVDPVNGVIVWCVTGPLRPRSGDHKDIGYYSAEAYEGLVTSSRADLKIGMRYWFMPHRCMLQWRHSGLVNFISRTPQALQIRVEGLMIG